MLIKVCGMRESLNISLVEALGIDMMGFIFYHKSPRYVLNIPDYLPTKSKRVGVFVDEDIDSVLAIAKSYKLDVLQLHGRESVAYCSALKDKGYSVIKAFSVADSDDILNTDIYADSCDMFVFDTKSDSIGGSGECFDWGILTKYHGNTPFLLSGGIGLHNIDLVRHFQHHLLVGYDLNSAFELSPAEKNIDTLTEFLEKIRDNE